MIQHSGQLKNFFVYATLKSKKKQITTQLKLVLNLIKKLLYFSKNINKENIYLKKITAGFIKQTLLLLKGLLIDFTILIKQKLIKKPVLNIKPLLKKHRIFQKTHVYL